MTWKKMIRSADIAQMEANHREQLPLKGTGREKDFTPVVRLHIPFTDVMWLLTELDEDVAFGLCQITTAELGSVWLPEMADIEIQGLRVIQDLEFKPTMTLGEYARRSRGNGWFISL